MSDEFNDETTNITQKMRKNLKNKLLKYLSLELKK